MITIECDNCEKTFEVDETKAGAKVPCPMCGDINRVPPPREERSESTTDSAPAKAHRGESSRGMSGEQEIMIVRPAMFRAHPFRFVMILAVISGGIALMIWSMASELHKFEGFVLWSGLLVLAGGGVWMLHWWVRTHMWIKITVSNKRTVRQEGIIRRHTTEVLHDHVRSVDIRQNFLQRIFNVGYIGIDSAGQDDIEIEIRDIPSPYNVKRTIDRHRNVGVGHD